MSRATAVFKPFRWPGLIWAVPIAALAIVAWLGLNAWLRRGPSLTVSFPIAGGLQAGSTKVEYHGFEVGEVHAVRLSKDLDRILVEIDFISSMAGHVGPGTRYWISGESLSFDNLASMKAILSGPFIGVDPKPGKTPHFAVGLSDPPDLHPPSPHSVPYQAVFPDSPEDLKPGAAVEFEGTRVGRVTRVEMSYDRTKEAIATRVDFDIDPGQIGLAGERWNLNDPRPQMDSMLSALIRHGLRAQLGTSLPVIGAKIVQLELVKGQPPARLGPGNPPEVPAIAGGSSLDQILDQVNGILATIKALPLGPIAGDVHQATSRLAAVSASPETAATLQRLAQTVTHLEALTKEAGIEVPSILRRLDKATASVEQAMSHVQSLLSSERMGNGGPGTSDLPHALYELSRAAQSLRELTDFLNSHPDALIFGRNH